MSSVSSQKFYLKQSYANADLRGVSGKYLSLDFMEETPPENAISD